MQNIWSSHNGLLLSWNFLWISELKTKKKNNIRSHILTFSNLFGPWNIRCLKQTLRVFISSADETGSFENANNDDAESSGDIEADSFGVNNPEAVKEAVLKELDGDESVFDHDVNASDNGHEENSKPVRLPSLTEEGDMSYWLNSCVITNVCFCFYSKSSTIQNLINHLTFWKLKYFQLHFLQSLPEHFVLDKDLSFSNRCCFQNSIFFITKCHPFGTLLNV